MTFDQQRSHRGLEQAWNECCRALGAADGEAIARNWVVLEALYAHPARGYHNLGHIAECLEECEAGIGLVSAEQGAVVRLAIFAHDCIYDARRGDNEARSAAVGVMLARDVGVGARHEADLRRLVLATTHRGEATDAMEGLIRDVDLASLAATPQRFMANTRAIRAEFAHVGDEEFRRGRLAFFEGMLGRSRIYALDVYRDRYEARARANLGRAVDELRG